MSPYDRIVDEVAEACSRFDVHSVLLVGSLSRGEGVWLEQHGRVTLLSDCEIIVVGCPSAQRQELASALRKVEAHYRPSNPAFHIDASFWPTWSLGLQPRSFFVFEARATGRVLVGRDVRDRLPVVSAKSIDRRELNEVLIWRMWLVLRAELQEISGVGKGSTASLAAAKATLDLVLFCLAEAGALVPGQVGRLEALRVKAAQDPDDPRWANLYYAAREAFAVRESGGECGQPVSTREGFFAALEHVDPLSGPDQVPQAREFGDISVRECRDVLASARRARSGRVRPRTSFYVCRRRALFYRMLRDLCAARGCGHGAQLTTVAPLKRVRREIEERWTGVDMHLISRDWQSTALFVVHECREHFRWMRAYPPVSPHTRPDAP